ncbi:alpha/beta hydrolase fold domain-containing protein [Arthrobacter cavernae]
MPGPLARQRGRSAGGQRHHGGEHDVLRDEGEAYAERMREEGVAIEHRRWPGQMHGFFTLVNVLPAGAEAMELIAGKIRAGQVA